MADADLRPMSLGEVLDRTFSLYKKHFGLFLGIMSVPLVALLAFLLLAVVLGISIVAVGVSGRSLGAASSTGILAGTMISVFIGAIAFLLVYAAAQVAAILAASDLCLGREVTIRGSFAKIRGKYLLAIGTMILTALLCGAGFIALIVPGFILLARTGLALPVTVLERESAPSAISRSMELTKGFGWSMFLIFVLYWVLSIIVALVFQYPLMFLAMVLASHQGLSLSLLILQNLASLFSSALIGPVYPIAFCVMYYNLRVRKEGFDLQHLMASLSPASPPAIEAPPAAPAI